MAQPTTRKTGVKKPGSGRTKGAVSIVTVSLEDLQRVFANPKQRIAVSRKFVEPFGITYELLDNQNPVPVSSKTPTTIKPVKKSPAIKSRDFSGG